MADLTTETEAQRVASRIGEIILRGDVACDRYATDPAACKRDATVTVSIADAVFAQDYLAFDWKAEWEATTSARIKDAAALTFESEARERAEAERDEALGVLALVLDRDTEWGPSGVPNECDCINLSREAAQEYEAGTCPHQIARELVKRLSHTGAITEPARSEGEG